MMQRARMLMTVTQELFWPLPSPHLPCSSSKTLPMTSSMVFLATALLYLILDLSFQIQSVTVSRWEELEAGAHLATALLPATYIKQIVNPLVLIYAEFYTD